MRKLKVKYSTSLKCYVLTVANPDTGLPHTWAWPSIADALTSLYDPAWREGVRNV